MEFESALLKDLQMPASDLTSSDQRLLDNGNEHASAKIPFSGIIDGRQFSGSSLSVVTAFVSGLSGPELDGKSRIAVLRFDFEGYSITLPVEVRISRTDTDTGELRLDFTRPTGEHLPVLRYLLNSYIAGDITSVDRIIELRERSGDPLARKQKIPPTFGGTVVTALRAAGAIVLTVALTGIVGNLAYQRLFSKEVTQLAVLSGNGQVLRAVASGQVSYLNTAAAKGDVVYALRSNSGDTLNVSMPCDCKVLPGRSSEGATVLAGDPIVEVAAVGATPVVLATMTPDLAKSLLNGNVAELQFANGNKAYAKPADGEDAFGPADGQNEVRVRLSPVAPVLDAPLGSPIAVRIVNSTVLSMTQLLSERVAALKAQF